MNARITGAAALLFLMLSTATIARADSVQTTDGRWLTGKNLKLSYDKVMLDERAFDAAEITEAWGSSTYENADFRNGETEAASGRWREAAASFSRAASRLRGAAREIALFKRLMCVAEERDVAEVEKAVRGLLAAFPKSFYFARAHEIRARLLEAHGDPTGARNALREVVNATGMNVRDLYQARLVEVELLGVPRAGRDKAELAAVRGAYTRLAAEIESRSVVGLARSQWLGCKVGIGTCHVLEGNHEEGLPYFEQVIQDPASLEHKALRAGAYTGRGHVRHARVEAELAGGPISPDERARIMAALDEAALDYLRVARFYLEYAGANLYAATVGVARVWATQFHVDGAKDCGLADRVMTYFVEAHRMLPRGETRRLLVQEAIRFRTHRDEACRAR